jgi:hypothetical protein
MTTFVRKAPVYGGVITWALSAVASGLSKRLADTARVETETVGVYGAERQRLLSISGAVVCALSTLLVMIYPQ